MWLRGGIERLSFCATLHTMARPWMCGVWGAFLRKCYRDARFSRLVDSHAAVHLESPAQYAIFSLCDVISASGSKMELFYGENVIYSAYVQGHNPHHQLETIVSVLGLPSLEELSFVTHPAARKAVMSKANSKPKDLESYFPADTSPLAMDLLRRMVRSCRVSRRCPCWLGRFHVLMCP